MQVVALGGEIVGVEVAAESVTQRPRPVGVAVDQRGLRQEAERALGRAPGHYP
ncbi:hypothetical protein [Actinokineospora sp. NPDC004072]